MNTKIELQQHELKKLDKQRKAWLVLSAFVIAVISFLIFDYIDIVRYGLVWQISVLGITLSVVWWYWAMRLIGLIIIQRQEELEMLQDIFSKVDEVKEEVVKIPPPTLD